MKGIFTLYIIVFLGCFASYGQNAANVLHDIENYKVITLPNGFRVQVVTSNEYSHCNCRLTVNVFDIDEGSKAGIKQVVAAMTGSELIANEIIVKNMISHNQALDSLLEFMSKMVFSESVNSVNFNDYKQRRLNYLKGEEDKPYKKTSVFADLQTGLKSLPADFLNSIDESDYFAYKKYCFSPERCLLTILSDLNPSEIESLATKYFGPASKQSPPVNPVSIDIKAKDIIYFVNDSMLSDVAVSIRNYFACQKTPKNYILNKLTLGILYGNNYNSVKDFSTYSYDVYSLDCTQSVRSFEDFGVGILKPRSENFRADSSLQVAKTRIINDFNEKLKFPDFATEIASYLILYKFPNNYFSGFEKNVNAVTPVEVQNFIKTVNKNGANVFVFNGDHADLHCAVLALTGERELDITDFEGNTTFSFEKGFSVKTIFGGYLKAAGLSSPPKNFSADYSSVYKYNKLDTEYSAKGHILRKTPNMYLLDNYILHTDNSEVFHYKEAFDGVNAFDSTKMYGMEPVDSLRYNDLKRKAFFPFEAYYDKTALKCGLECDYKSFKAGFFKIAVTDLNHKKSFLYYNIQTGFMDRVELLDTRGFVTKKIEYEYSQFDKYFLPSVIKESSFEMETVISFSAYNFSVSFKKADFFVGERGKKKK